MKIRNNYITRHYSTGKKYKEVLTYYSYEYKLYELSFVVVKKHELSSGEVYHLFLQKTGQNPNTFPDLPQGCLQEQG